MNNKITTIAFDADDTLWVNEPYFQEAEKQFCALLENYHPQNTISQGLRNQIYFVLFQVNLILLFLLMNV